MIFALAVPEILEWGALMKIYHGKTTMVFSSFTIVDFTIVKDENTMVCKSRLPCCTMVASTIVKDENTMVC